MTAFRHDGYFAVAGGVSEAEIGTNAVNDEPGWKATRPAAGSGAAGRRPDRLPRRRSAGRATSALCRLYLFPAGKWTVIRSSSRPRSASSPYRDGRERIRDRWPTRRFAPRSRPGASPESAVAKPSVNGCQTPCVGGARRIAANAPGPRRGTAASTLSGSFGLGHSIRERYHVRGRSSMTREARKSAVSKPSVNRS